MLEMLHKDIVYEVIGCAFEVLNELGYGLIEKPYENAMVVEFELRGIPYKQQPNFPIEYKEVRVGLFVPDLIVEDKVVVDTKVIDRITDQERGKMINYLKWTGLRVGLLINFKHAKLEWERIVL